MKRLVVGCLLLASVAAAEDQPDTGMYMTAGERQFIVQKMLNMQEAIDMLKRELQAEKVRTGCA